MIRSSALEKGVQLAVLSLLLSGLSCTPAPPQAQAHLSPSIPEEAPTPPSSRPDAQPDDPGKHRKDLTFFSPRPGSRGEPNRERRTIPATFAALALRLPLRRSRKVHPLDTKSAFSITADCWER